MSERPASDSINDKNGELPKNSGANVALQALSEFKAMPANGARDTTSNHLNFDNTGGLFADRNLPTALQNLGNDFQFADLLRNANSVMQDGSGWPSNSKNDLVTTIHAGSDTITIEGPAKTTVKVEGDTTTITIDNTSSSGTKPGGAAGSDSNTGGTPANPAAGADSNAGGTAGKPAAGDTNAGGTAGNPAAGADSNAGGTAGKPAAGGDSNAGGTVVKPGSGSDSNGGGAGADTGITGNTTPDAGPGVPPQGKTAGGGSDTTSGGTTPRTPGTPFASDSIFNMPLGSGAQWERNAQLAGAGVYVNTVGNYNENIYTSSASDPVVTVTNDASAGGTPGTFQVHIPNGAIPAGGNDKTFTVNDTSSGKWFSFGGFNWTGADTATVSQGSAEPFNGSGLTQDHSNWDQGVGTLTQNDLKAGTIDHMLRMELPFGMLKSWSSTSTTDLAPYAYPQTQEDGFALNGNGNPAYSGTIPYGVTIGIPAGTKEPADVAANPGAHMLWTALQTHGAMVRDSGGTDNNVIFQTDQLVDPNDPMIQAMNQYGSQIMAATQILVNQGPDSVNGGGTPVVPLIAPVS